MPSFLLAWAVKAFIALALLAAVIVTVRSYQEKLRTEGREEVRALWDADKAARIKRTTEIILQDLAARDKLEVYLGQKRPEIEVRTVTIIKEVPNALGTIGGLQLPPLAIRLFNDAISPGVPATPTGPGREPTPEPAKGPTVSDLEVVCIENAAEQLIQTNQLRGLLQRIRDYNSSLGAPQ